MSTLERLESGMHLAKGSEPKCKKNKNFPPKMKATVLIFFLGIVNSYIIFLYLQKSNLEIQFSNFSRFDLTIQPPLCNEQVKENNTGLILICVSQWTNKLSTYV